MKKYIKKSMGGNFELRDKNLQVKFFGGKMPRGEELGCYTFENKGTSRSESEGTNLMTPKMK